MCDVGYLCTNFSFPRHLSVLDLGPMYATETDRRHRLMPAIRGGDIIRKTL